MKQTRLSKRDLFFFSLCFHLVIGDLDTHLKMHQCLTEKESKLILAQVFEGLKYLNLLKRPVIHYDLKPGNILFDEFGGVKITDFGLSKIMEENSQDMDLTSQGAGTYWYLPPECFETGRVPPKISSKVGYQLTLSYHRNLPNAQQVDVWSAGVMFYQMLFGKKPFANNVSQQKILQENLIGRDVTLEFPTKTPSNNKVSEEAKTFLRSCLIADQEARPDVLKICEHSYLAMSKTKTKMPPPKTPRTTSKTSVFGVSSGSLSDLDDV
jgi:tousled-like kinase